MASADFENGPPLEGDTAPTIQLTGMNSAEKEKVSALDYNLFKVISYIWYLFSQVKFSKPVGTAPKSVEFWMCDLESMMRQASTD